MLSISSFSFLDLSLWLDNSLHLSWSAFGFWVIFQLCQVTMSFWFWLQAHLSSIYIPSSLFPLTPTDENITFQFSVFSNSKLFQEVKSKSKSKQLAKVTSSVLSLQFGELGIKCVEYMSCLSSARLTGQTKNMRTIYNERIKYNYIRFNQGPDKVDTGGYSIIYLEPTKRKKKRFRFERFLLITCTIFGRPSTFSRSVILNFMRQQLQASILTLKIVFLLFQEI